MQAVYDEIVGRIDEFSRAYLDSEYAGLGRKAAATLCRKRPSPLLSGGSNTWAGGIVHALCTVNFGFDKAEKPHTDLSTICEFFGIAKSTVAAKGKKVRELLKMKHYSFEWILQRLVDESSMCWIISVNGYLVDARSMPVEVQEIAFEKGLIPYIPAEGRV
ncbi:MAG: hypothetical protein JSS81_14405 [Acidobacteria bacterium]|nr:hypothetical protein [Acidobacteriota bacterium]